MKALEFLRHLAGTPRDWRLVGGKIRRGPLDDQDCPITAVARVLVGGVAPAAGGVNRAAYALDLDPRLASQLVAASDDLQQADPVVRARLLAACGLATSEEGKAPALQGANPGGAE